MNLYGLFILDVNIKYIVFSILYRHINVPMACKELIMYMCMFVFLCRAIDGHAGNGGGGVKGGVWWFGGKAEL